MPRRGVAETMTARVLGWQYQCTSRRREGISPSYFTSYAADVIAQAPTEVQNYWREIGFYFTARSALKHRLVVRLRGALVTGQGAAPFLKMLTEAHKLHHLARLQNWRCYVHLRLAHQAVTGPRVEKVPFYEFDSVEYGGFIPALPWLLRVAIYDI